MVSVHDGGRGGALGELAAFRQEFYRCLPLRADALFELTDAVLCADRPVTTLVGLSLAAEHRRGHGALYDGLDAGRIQVDRLRRSLASLPVPRDAPGRITLGVDVSPWLRPDAATCPDRSFCHVYGRGKGQAQMIPGWLYSFVAALEPGRTLVERCQSIITDARATQLALLRAAENGTDPRSGGLSDTNLAWLLLRHGPLGRAQVTRWTGVTSYAVAQTNLGRVTRTLFPTTDVAFAYVLLFGAYTGIVPDGIADLGVSDIDWAGEATILLDYVKGRSGPQSLTLPRQAVRLLEQWLEHSAPLRQVVGEQLRSQLWIRLNQGLGPTLASETGTPASALVFRNGLSRRWATTHDLTVDGVPISLHRSRIRTTYQNLLSRRGWTGRTTIDPNHSAAVEGDHYPSVTTPSQQDAVEAIIEDGQADLLRKAQPPRVLTDDQAADAAAGLPQLAAEHGLDDAAITELLGGQRDVFVAACTNQLASPFGPAGKPCPARPWVCLLCPLAVFLPRHLSNLLRLKGFFSRQFRQQPTTAFLAVFGPYAHRLETDILPRFDQQAVTAAAHALDTAADTTTSGGVVGLLPLRPEELA